MRVLALQALSFRNLEQVTLEAHPRFNVVWGDNGQGKTNLLEAIYLVGTLRSFRASKSEELVGFGAREARVRARVDKDEMTRVLEVRVSPGHKTARIDGKGTRASDYFGGMNVVLFQPDDLRLPRGAPGGAPASRAPAGPLVPPAPPVPGAPRPLPRFPGVPAPAPASSYGFGAGAPEEE